ncbi:hypothetical protein HGRIS_014422 [Hohenbuehelia grisea]|uniref:DNA helicase n=1 Tax=Hohenbuehelia grisea TaxID=104357 RepID=A0ABR3JTG6_9AGAR
MPAPSVTDSEAAFLNDLLADLDDSFWNATPSSPVASPAKPPPTRSPPRSIPSTHKPLAYGDPKTPTKRSQRNISQPSTTHEVIDLTALTEGAADWDWQADLLSSPVRQSPRKSEKITEPDLPSYIRDVCTRCTVESVSTLSTPYRKELLVKIDGTDVRRHVVLQDDWTAMEVQPGDTLNVIGNFDARLPSSSSSPLSISITSQKNFVIHHPDYLITATALSNASQCLRKPILQSMVRSQSDVTPALVWGHILHEVMQACLATGRWEENWLDQRITQAVLDGLADLVKIDASVEHAQKEVKARAKGLQPFARKYMSSMPKSDAFLTNTRAKGDETSLLAITEFLDAEEDIWSPTYGIKGKIDATVQSIIVENTKAQRFFGTSPPVSSIPRPFEIKTGRSVAGMEHRAQTMLYTILVEERYGVEVPDGLLYYTQNEEVVAVPRGRNEIRGLIMARNEMAGYMARRARHLEAKQPAFTPEVHAFLPPTVDDQWVCKRCNVVDTCMLYRKAVENVVDTDSPIADTYAIKTDHLTPSQSAFFKDWENLLSLEEQDAIKFKKELWTLGAEEREQKGRCFAGMFLDESFRAPATQAVDSRSSKIHQFTYRFVRHPRFSQVGPHRADNRSLLSGHLNIGEAITVSVEPDLLALARGFILELTPTEVVVGVDHELGVDAIWQRLRALRGLMTLSKDAVVFRIDKDELFGGMSRMRGNLAHLFYADGDARRRELIVDLRPPVFDDGVSSCATSAGIAETHAKAVIERYSQRLNANQAQAVRRVLTAQDYALILGMPGTGKTTVIAAIIRMLVALGKTVLLTSHTHSAVDNILLKLDDADFGILRVGNVDKIHPGVLQYTLSSKKKASTIEQLEQQILVPPVVATTCLSLENALFMRRTFDYCIVDEASQITLPTCLGPLRFADKFVLVGDHFQLPPLVRNRDARKGGLDVSLFRRLSDAHPHSVTDLVYQYRMNKEIMLLSNRLIYGDRLKCGSEAVAQSRLVRPDPKAMLHTGRLTCGFAQNACWLERLISEECKAIFVDTDALPARDSRVGDLVQNEVEASLVYQVTEALLRSGISEEQIGVISLYRQQIKLLTHLLHARAGVEILTADRSQGRDKDCVLISLVRSNEAGQVGDLVKDWRRMNVSFTRARSKLILFGSRKTLEPTPLLSEFFKLVDAQGWVLKLPPAAHEMHPLLQPAGRGEIAKTTPIKRSLKESSWQSSSVFQKENQVILVGSQRPQKKMRITPAKPSPMKGILRGRPILQDLVLGEA